MITAEELYAAYKDCMRRKQNVKAAIEFDKNREANLRQLLDEINDYSYTVSESTAFVVSKPKYREIFAANFRDRIVHHYIALRIEPILQGLYIPSTFSCIKERGTLAAQMYCSQIMNKITKGYTQEAWVASFDIQGFFYSIKKLTLWEKVKSLIVNYYFQLDRDTLLFLCWQVIFNRPEQDCQLRGDVALWKKLDYGKSLFDTDGYTGIPIGNLSSQIFANLYMLNIDKWVFDVFKGGYLRYVDDSKIISTDKRKILDFIPEYRQELANLGLKLHKRKFNMQQARKGTDCVGRIIKKERIYVRNKTIHTIKWLMPQLDCNKKNLARINSYLGILQVGNEYHNRRKIGKIVKREWYDYGYFDKGFKKYVFKNNINQEKMIATVTEYNKLIQIGTRWFVQWDKEELEDGTFRVKRKCVQRGEKPTAQKCIEVIQAEIDKDTDAKILTGYEYDGHNVYLSRENQNNYKAMFDLAVMDSSSVLPLTIKICEENGQQVYETFEDLDTFKAFYVGGVTYINTVLTAGWTAKDTIANEFAEV